MADFETKLRWLSERGHPVGAEELIERMEAQLAGNPLVVVTKRREGKTMTTTRKAPPTEQPPTDRKSRGFRGPAFALAAFIAVIAVAAVIFVLANGSDDGVVSPLPTTTTVPEVDQATIDIELIKTAVAALYSGDAERAAQLFELEDRTDDQIREDAAYQKVVEGRLAVNCRAQAEPGVYNCTVPYHNALTDAINHGDTGDRIRVVVEDGVVTEFAFPEHSFIMMEMGAFLATQGRFEGYEGCDFGPFSETCGIIQMANVDAWAEWRKTVQPETIVDVTLKAWFGGDCDQARFLSLFNKFDDPRVCPGRDQLFAAVEDMAYESLLAADVTVENCQELPSPDPDEDNLSCEVHYANVMNEAVGKSPAVIDRDFTVLIKALLVGQDEAWYEFDYPEDTELRESFRTFAESGDLRAEFTAAGCATNRTAECAQLILDNLDAWAAWYPTNQ